MRDLKRSQFDIFLAITPALAIVLLDRITKNFFSQLLDLGESLPIVHNVFHMTLVHNTGIAFGFFKDMGAVFIVIPLVVIALLIFNIYYYRQNNEALSHSYIFSFSLILGGAIGNLIDRIMYGYVIDFVDLRIWPVFNVADSAITIGAVVIALKCFQLSSK
jgi:signal peptidase II